MFELHLPADLGILYEFLIHQVLMRRPRAWPSKTRFLRFPATSVHPVNNTLAHARRTCMCTQEYRIFSMKYHIFHLISYGSDLDAHDRHNDISLDSPSFIAIQRATDRYYARVLAQGWHDALRALVVEK